MTELDDIELNIHHEAWQIVERILDQRRRKVTLRNSASNLGSRPHRATGGLKRMYRSVL